LTLPALIPSPAEVTSDALDLDAHRSLHKVGEAFPIRNHTAPTVVKQLVSQVFTRFGCPKQLLSGQGPEFRQCAHDRAVRKSSFDKVCTSPYKASTNGAVERFHRALNGMLEKLSQRIRGTGGVATSRDGCVPWRRLLLLRNLFPTCLLFGRRSDDACGHCTGEARNKVVWKTSSYDSFVSNMAARLERGVQDSAK